LKDEERKIHTLKFRGTDKCTVHAVQGNSRGYTPSSTGGSQGHTPCCTDGESEAHTAQYRSLRGAHPAPLGKVKGPAVQGDKLGHTPYSTGDSQGHTP
jgi:hypothetical protein